MLVAIVWNEVGADVGRRAINQILLPTLRLKCLDAMSVIRGHHLVVYLLELLIIRRLQLIFSVFEILDAHGHAVVEDVLLLLTIFVICSILYFKEILLFVLVDVVFFGENDRMQFLTENRQFDSVANEV